MKKILLAGVTGLILVGSGAVYAQHRPWFQHHVRMNPEDRAAFLDSRIAAVRAGLKLTPDQDKLWPPVEAAVRDLIKLRTDRANARMQAEKDQPPKDGAADQQKAPDNPVVRLQQRADNMAATAAALKKVADAADPLYKTLDDGQKRRLAILTHREGPFGGHHEGWRHHGGPGRDGDRGFQRGSDRDGPDGGGSDRGFDRDRGPGPERL